jgi:hypothetical protein
METLGRTLLVGAVLLAICGSALLVLSRMGLNRLPGDVVYHGKNVVVYAPFGLMLFLSILLTIVLNLFWRR